MSTAPEPQPEKPRFLPAYGKASMLFGVFSIVCSKGGSIVIASLRTTPEDQEKNAAIIKLLAQISIGLIGLMVVLALVFGVLSLFGVGKQNGSSRPGLGIVGILLALLMGWVLPAAVHVTREAAERARNQPVVKQE